MGQPLVKNYMPFQGLDMTFLLRTAARDVDFIVPFQSLDMIVQRCHSTARDVGVLCPFRAGQ